MFRTLHASSSLRLSVRALASFHKTYQERLNCDQPVKITKHQVRNIPSSTTSPTKTFAIPAMAMTTFGGIDDPPVTLCISCK